MAFEFIHGSIRKKLIYIVMLATLPVFAVLLWNELADRKERMRTAEHDTMIFLSGFSELQRRVTDSTRSLLSTLAELPEIKSHDPEASQRALSTILKANPIYTNAILIDSKGDVIAMGKGKNKGFNFAERKQFRDAMVTRQFAYGEFVVGKQSRKSIFPFAAPVLNDQGVPTGAIMVGVDLSHLSRLYDKSDFPKGSFFGLCDHKGTRVFRLPLPDGVEIGKPIKKVVFDTARNAGKSGFLVADTTEGKERIVAYDPLRLTPEGEPYMYMFMGLDRGLVMAKANQSLMLGAITGVVSLCFALCFAWLLGWKTIAAKIDRLSSAARQLGRGTEIAPSGLDYSDGEIGELAESFDTMSVLLKKREEDLQTAKKAAEDANRAKDEFLANISHEVRTPLNGVMGMLQLLRETTVDKEQDSFLSTALQSSKNLLRVLNDLLDFIKVGVGKMELLKEPFDIEDLIRQSTGLFQLQLEEKGISLETYIFPEAYGQYIGDAGRIRQIVFNLLGNAIKFTQTGSIRIEVFTLPHPDERYRRLFFSIEDTGVGIPDDKIDYIFDAFTQVDGSLSRQHQGTGLGLPIVKKLVSLMNGNCVIESEVGCGTTVLFCVQVAEAPPMSDLEIHAKSEDLVTALRVLLVEDEAVNRIMAQRLLEKMGHTVVCAENGQEALDALLQDSFDLVLMDIQMPILDGLSATQAIRKNADFSQVSTIPIIALSAHAAEQDKKRAYEAGIDIYVTKPFETETLRLALFRAVAQKK